MDRELINKVGDIERRLQALERLDVNPPLSGVAQYSGTPVAGAVTYWTGAGTVAPGSIAYGNSGTPYLAATSSVGYRFQDDGGTVAMRVHDGGQVSVGSGNTPTSGVALGVSNQVAKSVTGGANVATFGSNDSSNQLQLLFQVQGHGTAANRGAIIHALEQDVAFRPLMLNPTGGGVLIGGTVPSAYALDVTGDINVSGNVRKAGTAYNNPDYVFEDGYSFLSLEKLGAYLANNKRLPGMPSTEDVRRDGVILDEQVRLLLEKLEEAYLYILQLHGRIAVLEARA